MVMMPVLSAPLSSLEYEEAVLMAAQDVGGVTRGEAAKAAYAAARAPWQAEAAQDDAAEEYEEGVLECNGVVPIMYYTSS